ncbi:MAG: hypothetical protein V1644_00325 [Candidatus Micrarchaeota archaeon]
MKEKININKLTFMELFSALEHKHSDACDSDTMPWHCADGGAKVPLKFSVEQNNVRLGVDRGGSTLVQRK